MGHVAMLRRYGIRASAPMFIPGLGALVRLEQYPHTPAEDARVGLAGPMWGLGAAAIAWGVYTLTGWPAWGAIARVGAWINLFNLIPVWQLDGSRAFVALCRSERWVAVGALARQRTRIGGLEHDAHPDPRERLEPAARGVPAHRAQVHEGDVRTALEALRPQLGRRVRQEATMREQGGIRLGALQLSEAGSRADGARKAPALCERPGVDRQHLDRADPESHRELDALATPGQVGPARAELMHRAGDGNLERSIGSNDPHLSRVE